jgi:uncharacterized protein (TIGR00730 family)
VSRLCVFCGSSPGLRPAYLESARTVGRLLAERRIGLVFGGGRVGLMGALADAALEAGGEAIGVIPRILEVREVAHSGLTKLHVVETMHERKALMTEYADAFLALPGGYGTLDELFEAITWRQLGYHDKPTPIPRGSSTLCFPERDYRVLAIPEAAGFPLTTRATLELALTARTSIEPSGTSVTIIFPVDGSLADIWWKVWKNIPTVTPSACPLLMIASVPSSAMMIALMLGTSEAVNEVSEIFWAKSPAALLRSWPTTELPNPALE